MPIATLLLLGYLIAATYIFFALCCGPTQANKNSTFAKIHYYTTTYLFETIKLLIGKRIWDNIINIGDYVINKPNPILQIFYLFLVLGGYYLFVIQGGVIKYLPGPYISEFHVYTAHLVFGLALFFFFKASTANPGIVTELNRDLVEKYWPQDQIIYPPKKCKVCLIDRPARVKHCNICGHCVSRFDHHCPWVNNCVGENNVRYFHGFLFFTALLVAYVGWITYYVLAGELENWKKEYRPKWNPSFFNRFQWAMHYFPMPTPVGLFCIMASIFVFGFWLYHVYLIYRNTTTYETFKRSDYISFVKIYHKRDLILSNAKKNPPKTEKEKERIKITAEKFKDMPKPSGVVLNDKNEVILKNPFQRGFISNFKEVLFPNPIYQNVRKLGSIEIPKKKNNKF